MSTTTKEEIDQVVEYLIDTDESTDSKVSVVKNAVQSNEFSIDDVLSEYASECAIEGAIYPMHETEIRKIREGYMSSTGEMVDSIDKLCRPMTIIEDKTDVISQAVDIYVDDSVSGGKRERIIELLKAAQRDGINISKKELVNSLKEVDEKSNQGVKNQDGLTGHETQTQSFAKGIQSPDIIKQGAQGVYKVVVSDSVVVDRVSWYVSGSKVGTGESITHSFKHTGEYNMSAEVVSQSGETDYVSKDVSVDKKGELNVSIIGKEEVNVGDSCEFIADVVANNEDVDEIEWKLNGVKVSTGDKFATTFEEGATHDLSVTVESVSGETAEDNIPVSVILSTDLSVSVDAPNVVYAGEKEEITGEISVTNTEITSATCKIKNDNIELENEEEVEIEYEFDTPGEYPITLTGVTSTKETDTAVTTTQCVADAVVEFDEITDEVVHGETHVFSVTRSDELNGVWSVTGATIESRSDEEITITFDDENRDQVEIEYTVSNDIGETTTISNEISISKPVIDIVIDAPETVIKDEVATLSVADSEIENTSIEEVQWKLNDESYIGKGESVSHKFTTVNEHTIEAKVTTTLGSTETKSTSITVEAKPQLNPVIIQESGETTNDIFTFSGAKSVVQNDEVLSYTWIVDGEREATDKKMRTEFEEPGNHEIKLKIKTKSGLKETEVEEINVRQYTDIDVSVDGPSDVLVNDEQTYYADVDLTNTSTQQIDWIINGEVIANGETLNHSFETPGHYTMQVEAVSITGDKSKTNPKEVIVDTPDSVVNAKLSVTKVDGVVVTGVKTNISANPTIVENGDVKKYEWIIDGEKEVSDKKFTNKTFSEYGEKKIQLTVTTFDEVSDSTTTTIYVTPNRDDIPYINITGDENKADVFGEAIGIFQDDDLTIEYKNRAAATLVAEATAKDVNITETEVEEYLIDFDHINGEDVNIQDAEVVEKISDIEEVDNAATSQQEVTDEWDVTDESGAQSDTASEETETELEEDVEFGVGEESEGEETASEGGVEDSVDDFGVKTRSDDDESEEAELEEDVEFGIDEEELEDESESEDNKDKENGEVETDQINSLGDSDIFTEKSIDRKVPEILKLEDDEDDWESDEYSEYTSVRSKFRVEHSDSYQDVNTGTDDEGENKEKTEYSRQADEPVNPDRTLAQEFEIDPLKEDLGEENKEIKISPESYDIGESVLAMPNYAQDLLDFEYVLDEDDDLAPKGGNAAGIVVTEQEEYIAIARVEGRDWSIHTGEKKQEIIKTYESHVLSGLDNHVQMLSVPTRFDIREHIDLVNDVLDENSDDEDEMLMNIGRSIYPNWIENFMNQNDMKERQFYLVVTMSAKQLNEFKTANKDITEQLAELPVIGDTVFSRFTDNNEDDIEKYQILRELNKRMGRVKSNLRRMEVEVERVDSRQEAMSVLYQYYQNTSPEDEVFPTGPITGVKDEYEIGGIDITDEITEHEPAGTPGGDN